MHRLAHGDVVALRGIWDRRVRTARAVVVVQHEPSQVTLCALAGTLGKGPARRDGTHAPLPELDWRLVDRLTDSTILSFAWPGTAYAVLLYFEQATGILERFYVNLQDPLRRTRIGFDTTDHVLDVLVEPDRSAWRWKDEDELADAIRRGLFTPAQAESFRAEGERAVRRIVDGDPPFDRDWSGWRPPATWPIPRLPDGWDDLEP